MIDQTSIEFINKWRDFVDNFLATPENKNICKAYQIGNILTPENRNVSEHQIMARVVVEVLCDLCGVTGKEKEEAMAAASLHDFNVIEEKIGRRSGTYKTYRDLDRLKEKDRNTLRDLGFSEEVSELTDANITHETGGPNSLPAMFIFLADACISGTKIVDIKQRFEETRKGWRSDKNVIDQKTAEENAYYYDVFWKGAPGHGDRPHDEVQLETAFRICAELTTLIKERHQDIDSRYDYIFGEKGNPNLFPEFICDKVNEKILKV